MRQGPQVLRDVILRTQHWAESVARIVAGSPSCLSSACTATFKTNNRRRTPLSGDQDDGDVPGR